MIKKEKKNQRMAVWNSINSFLFKHPPFKRLQFTLTIFITYIWPGGQMKDYQVLTNSGIESGNISPRPNLKSRQNGGAKYFRLWTLYDRRSQVDAHTLMVKADDKLLTHRSNLGVSMKE